MSTADLEALLQDAAGHAGAFRRSVRSMDYLPRKTPAECLTGLGGPVPETPSDARVVIAQMASASEGGLMMQSGPRFFGWVMGASHPAGVAADALVRAWGQLGAPASVAPAIGVVEDTAERWLLELLDLPRESSIGFVSGATMGHFTGLAAARGEVLRKVGWDADEQGLFGAPPVTVIVGAEAHATVFMALQFVGFGRDRVSKIKSDAQGRMDVDDLATTIGKVSGPVVVILQAGHLNSGAFDDFKRIVRLRRQNAPGFMWMAPLACGRGSRPGSGI
jgi:glutamate/tyrosine decarboxylase-like PLP-dependent enzyme